MDLNNKYFKIDTTNIPNNTYDIDMVKEDVCNCITPCETCLCKNDVKIKYLEGAKELVINPNGNCIDLYAYEDVFIPYMGYAMVSLGVAMELPNRKVAKLYPRSSTFKTWGVIMTNSLGYIDEAYCGDKDIWHMPLQCTMPKQTEKIDVNGHKVTMSGTWIKKDDKICQFEIVDAMIMPTFKSVESLGNSDRGGFGSSGTK